MENKTHLVTPKVLKFLWRHLLTLSLAVFFVYAGIDIMLEPQAAPASHNREKMASHPSTKDDDEKTHKKGLESLLVLIGLFSWAALIDWGKTKKPQKGDTNLYQSSSKSLHTENPYNGSIVGTPAYLSSIGSSLNRYR